MVVCNFYPFFFISTPFRISCNSSQKILHILDCFTFIKPSFFIYLLLVQSLFYFLSNSLLFRTKFLHTSGNFLVFRLIIMQFEWNQFLLSHVRYVDILLVIVLERNSRYTMIRKSEMLWCWHHAVNGNNSAAIVPHPSHQYDGEICVSWSVGSEVKGNGTLMFCIYWFW